MAYVQNYDEDELNENGGAPVMTGPQGATLTGGPTPTNGPISQKAPTPDKPGNFVGIKQYIDANKNQAAQLGDQAAGVINQSADQARQSIGALNQSAADQIKGVQSLNSDLAQKLAGGAEALSQDERNTIKNTANAQYTGPKAVADFGDTYNQALKDTNKAKENVANAGTEQGRMNLITQINSKPRTMGQNIFDNVLLQTGGGREKVGQAAEANQDVKTGLDAASEAIQAQIGKADDPNTPDVNEATGAIGQTNAAQQDAYKQIQDAMNAWKTNFTPKVQQAQNDLVAQQNRITQDIADNPYGLEDETLLALGLGEGTSIYDVDLNKYLNQVSPSDINASNVASAEDYARYGALADLSGEQDLMLKPYDISKAGTAGKTSFNTEALMQAIRDAEAPYTAKASASTPIGDYLPSIPLPGMTRSLKESSGHLTVDQLKQKLASDKASLSTADAQNVAMINQMIAAEEKAIKAFEDDLKRKTSIQKNTGKPQFGPGLDLGKGK